MSRIATLADLYLARDQILERGEQPHLDAGFHATVHQTAQLLARGGRDRDQDMTDSM